MDDGITGRLQPIFEEVFDDESLRIRPDMKADDVDGWDSFSHIRLVQAVEQAFKVKFSAREINKLKDVV